MRVTQLIVALEAAVLVAAGPVNHHKHNRHQHLHHRSLNYTFPSNATNATTVYADVITHVTSTVSVTPLADNATDVTISSVDAITTPHSDASSATAAIPDTAPSNASVASSNLTSSFLSLSHPLAYVSGAGSSSSAAVNSTTPAVIPSSYTVITANSSSTTPTAVAALSQTTDTVVRTITDTVYLTTTVDGSLVTHSTSEQLSTVTDTVTKYVTATFSALTPLRDPARRYVSSGVSSGSVCNVKTTIITLPANMSPTLVASPGSTSLSSSPASKGSLVAQPSSQATTTSTKKVVSTSTKSSVQTTVTASSSKTSATSSNKTASTSTKKSSSGSGSSSTPSKQTSTSIVNAGTTSTAVAGASSVKASTSTKKASTSTAQASASTVKTTVQASSSVKSSAKPSTSTKVSSGPAKASSSICSTAAAPAATQAGIVSGCTQWYTAVSGDYCYKVASSYGLDVNTFMAWNPAVNAPSCSNMQVGHAYCVAAGCSSSGSATTLTSVGTSAAAAASSKAASSSTKAAATSTKASTGTTNAGTTSTSAAASTSTGSAAYKMYTGDGTVAAGWPSMNQWVSFDTMFTLNTPIMQKSCSNNGWGADNSADEIANIKTAITDVSEQYDVDPRFILAIVMQESNGCVRVVTTSWSVANPGLMQDHAGNGTCNSGGVVQNPCPYSEINQMITDGTAGTSSGDGLVQCLAETGASDVSRYYRAARIYNGGAGGYNADNLNSGCCTLCYATDVANRLTGWSTGTTGCTLS